MRFCKSLSSLCLYVLLIIHTVTVQANPNAQFKPLLQKGLLGLRPVSTAANALVEVQSVLDNSTSSSLGLQTGDVLITINDENIRDFNALLRVIERFQVGDKLNVVVNRNNEEIMLTSFLKGRPRESSKYATVDYGEVRWNKQQMRSITYTPLSASLKKSPAIYFLQGYTCGSFEFGMIPDAPALQLVEQFVKAGFIVYRVEKLGVGESQGSLKCSEIDFTTEVSAFTAGLRTLKQNPLVDADKLFLWGHSLGVLFAPAIAKKETVSGIIGYGGVMKPWYDYMLDIYLKQSVKHFNTPEKTANNNVKLVEPFMNDWLKSDKPWSDVLNNKEAVDSNLIPIQGEQVFHRHYSFFRDANRYNFKKIWQELQLPTLMIHGSLDIQAIDESWAFDIAKVVNKEGKDLAKAKIVNGAEHGFLSYKNAEEYMSARQQFDPSSYKTRFEKKIGEITIEWINRL